MTKRIASCSCGQLTATTSTDPIRVSVCHCLACQRRTGSAFGAQARFSKEATVVEGKSLEYVRVGDEGGRATFYFCPCCGATVHYALEGLDDILSIPVGAFADPAFHAPTISIYEERMHEWVQILGNIEHLK